MLRTSCLLAIGSPVLVMSAGNSCSKILGKTESNYNQSRLYLREILPLPIDDILNPIERAKLNQEFSHQTCSSLSALSRFSSTDKVSIQSETTWVIVLSTATAYILSLFKRLRDIRRDNLLSFMGCYWLSVCVSILSNGCVFVQLCTL